jgi:hypothetical protein
MADKIKNLKERQEQPQEFQIGLVPNYEKAFPSFYSNYAVVSHTASELCIDFCVLAPPHDVDVEKKTASVPVVARALIPVSLTEGLIDALRDQLSKHAAEKGKLVIAAGGKK